MTNLIGQLPGGPLDIVGDVHGEIDALRALLGRLGYRDDCSNSEDRRLVFVEDLVDRGPDSPAALELVMRLVEAKRAQCLLGNLDLNLVLDSSKKDNFWWNDPHKVDPNVLRPVRLADKQRYRQFLERLPLVLERPSGPTPIRVVHAAWHTESVVRLKADAGQFSSIKELHDHYKAGIADQWAGTKDAAQWDKER